MYSYEQIQESHNNKETKLLFTDPKTSYCFDIQLTLKVSQTAPNKGLINFLQNYGLPYLKKAATEIPCVINIYEVLKTCKTSTDIEAIFDQLPPDLFKNKEKIKLFTECLVIFILSDWTELLQGRSYIDGFRISYFLKSSSYRSGFFCHRALSLQLKDMVVNHVNFSLRAIKSIN